MAKLYFRFSPMNTGKTTSLLMEAHSFESRGINILCIKPSIDNRDGSDVIKSRMGIERECLLVHPFNDIYEIVKDSVNDKNYKLNWILVDECQFLTAQQVDQLRRIVDDFEINVKCYGLRTDFRTKLFEGSKRLFEVADSIEEMKMSCDCGRKAIFNVRYNELGQVVTDGEQILIGGEDIYKAKCSKCYYEEIRKQNEN